MKKKGFTLIELIAVIVILAVIAIIAIPTFTNVIEKSRKEAAKSSALTYMSAVENYSVVSELKSETTKIKPNQSYNCLVGTIIGEQNYLPLNDLINIKGYKPTGRNDYLTLGPKGEVLSGEINIAGYAITIEDKEIVSIVKGIKVNIETLALNFTEQTMEKGSTFKLTPIFTPIDTSDQRITYSSSDTSIVTVTDTGIVTAKKNGTAKVTVTSKSDTSKKEECIINVITSASSVTVAPSSSVIEVGSTVQLTGTIEPGDVTTNSLTWTSSNENIAHVDESGLVTGMSPGTATIKARTVNGKESTSEITVYKIDAESITLNKSSFKVQISRQYQLTATILPADTTDKSVIWTSSNTSVATVSSSGIVEGKALGTATITAKTHNNISVTANVTVTDYCDYLDDEEIVFDYTGSVQTFKPKCTGKYKLEVWGAQGGGSYPGYGGYSVGTYPLTKDQSIYVYVGGQGLTSVGTSSGGGAGYNGGGQGYNGGGGGGGMTHISKTSTDNPTSSWVKNTNYIVSSLNVSQTIINGTTYGFYTSTTSTRNFYSAGSGTSSYSGTAYCYTSSASLDPYCKICVGGTGDSYCSTNDDGNNDVATGTNCYATKSVSSGQKVYCYLSAYKTSDSSSQYGTANVYLKIGSANTRTSYSYSNTTGGNFDNNTSNVLIVAGGGGGSTDSSNSRGGSGGGFKSSPVKVSGSENSSSYYANQSTGYTTGRGGSSSTNVKSAGGGAGWYGGRVSNSTDGGAGGGSGWIQNSTLYDKHMTCFNCPTDSSTATKTNTTDLTGHAKADKANTGNGYARITYIGK